LKKTVSSLLTLSTLLVADKVMVQTIACPELDIIKNSTKYADDIMALNQYAIANGCKFLTHLDAIEAIDYDPATQKSIYIKILDKKSGSILYTKRQHIQIEQPGKKNSIRF